MVDGFSTLAQLVKETKSGQVVVPDVRNEVESIKPGLDVLNKAGFTAVHDELNLQVRTMERAEKAALLCNRLADDGYLIIDIPFYFKGGWNYTGGVFVKPIPNKPITRTVEVENFWRTKTVTREITETVQSTHSLMLCQHYQWRGGVPVSVAEALIEFREKYGLEDAITDFKVLSVLPNSQIRDYVNVDPLLLYSLDGHSGSRFAVVAWWGADVEAIEKELGLDRESFRSVKVLEALR